MRQEDRPPRLSMDGGVSPESGFAGGGKPDQGLKNWVKPFFCKPVSSALSLEGWIFPIDQILLLLQVESGAAWNHRRLGGPLTDE